MTMGVFYSANQGLTETVNFLEYRLNALANKMRNSPERLRVDAAFVVPFRNRGEVDSKLGIAVTALRSDSAIAQVIHGLTAIRIEEGKQNPRETLRVPGVVALPEEWIQELNFLNTLRAEIHLLVRKIDDPRQRLEVWKAWAHMSGKQVMRRTRIVDGPRKITFFWDSAPSVINKPASKWIEEFENNLIRLHGYVPNMNELSDGDGSRNDLFLIGALRSECNLDEPIAAFRFGQPHVRARITFHSTQKLLLRPAPTPIVYEYRDSVPTIIPLSSWEPDISTTEVENRQRVKLERKTRAQTISDQPLVSGQRFYRYLKS